ncbi:Ribosomal protein L28e [Mucor velutinosus]|uniref:Ribosomal protein L28e n=1 Tax=Mucor velutinosus TaxID=708070 RepID=A0AAN7DIJ1_9FUNG|nr:Ribosomal protein L28e [Mucor velutinosus]
MSSHANKVQCPICHQWVVASKINAHIDANCPDPSLNSLQKQPSTHMEIDNDFPKLEITTANDEKKAETKGSNSSSVASKPSASSSPVRIAPLFAPKAQQPSSKAASSPSLSTSLESRPMPTFGGIKRQQPADAISPATTTTTSSSSTSTAQPTTKRSKRSDAVLDSMPLAARVRPITLTDFVGQEELLGPDGILKKLIDHDRIPSMVLWGPPGCGKTTIARIISKMTKSRFVELSATSHGAADVKKAFEDAKGHLMLTGQKTFVFIDEIHRFTKTQQDLFLPYVEQGTIHLIGATTENPSFKVNSALLSRCKVFVLKRLDQDQIESILTRGLQKWRGEEEIQTDHSKDKEALKQLAVYSDGDARTALNTLEIAVSLLPSKQHPLEIDTVKGAFQKSHLLYDRNGDQHYDIISALHKSIRGSDADAALYWLGRMLVAGEDPLYIARRLVRCASEDIGLADNTALPLAMAAYTACEKIGMPECDTILAHLVVHLAETKKSVRSYKAYNLVKQTIQDNPAYSVPMHIRNAPTTLMKNLGYGEGYKYNPDYQGPVEQTYLPDELQFERFLE